MRRDPRHPPLHRGRAGLLLPPARRPRDRAVRRRHRAGGDVTRGVVTLCDVTQHNYIRIQINLRRPPAEEVILALLPLFITIIILTLGELNLPSLQLIHVTLCRFLLF